MKDLRARSWTFIAGLSLSALAAAQAHAQDTPVPIDKPDTSVSNDEIVVTAERRTTSLMSSPLSASVLSQDDLKNRSILNLDSLPFAAPALTVSSYGGGNLVNIRGVGRSEVVTQASAGVPIYRDGVPTFNAYFSSAEPYFDIKDIQVLRGPQGTFAGQNSTGGAIFVRTADPDPAEVGGYVQLGIGNYTDLQAQAAINIPISDTLAIRLSGDAEHRKGFYDYSGSYSGHPDRFARAAGRVGLLWRPSDRFEAVVKVDYDYADAGANTYAPIASPNDLFDISSNTNLFAVDRFVRVGGTLSYTFGDGTILRSITGYQFGRTRQKSDSDGTDIGNVTLEYRATEEITSQEINLISPEDLPLRFVLGAFYSNSVVDLPVFEIESPPLVIAIDSKLRRDNTAIFGHFSYDLAPGLELEAGARFNHATVRQNLLTTLTFAGFPLGTTPGPSSLPDDDKVTGKIGLSYQINPQHFLYGFVATGHKNSGLNTSIFSPPSFAGETVTDYEAGYKGSFLDNRLRFQASFYHYDYKNYQFNQYDVTTRSAVIRNVPGKSKSEGVELQLDGNFGVTNFNLAASYSTSKLATYFAVDPRDPPVEGASACLATGPSTSTQCLDLSGRRLPFQPKFTLSAGLDRRFNLGSGTLTPRVDVAYLGGQYTTVFQVPTLDTLKERTLVNAQLAYRTGTWTATLYATNLLDKHYIAAKLSGLRVAGAPRQFGLRVMKTF